MRTLLAATLCALLVGACGGSEQDKVSAAATDFAHAFARGDTEKACDLMTGKAKREIAAAGAMLGGGTDCPKVLKSAIGLMDKGELKQLEDYQVKSVKLSGDTATITDNTTDEDGKSSPTNMRKVDGDWLIDSDEAG